MSKVPTRFAALFTKAKLAEILSRTYAEAKLLDTNEGYTRLEDALTNLQLISGLQAAIYRAARDSRPKLDDDALADLIGKKLGKRKVFSALNPTRSSSGPLAAVTILIDKSAGFSSGEAYDLLESPEGAVMLEKGFDALGAHIVKLLLK